MQFRIGTLYHFSNKYGRRMAQDRGVYRASPGDPLDSSRDEDAVLDQLFMSTEEDEKTVAYCTPASSIPSTSYSSTWPCKVATKRTEKRLSFLDLPAEIRIAIYETYCQAVLDNFDRLALPTITIDDNSYVQPFLFKPCPLDATHGMLTTSLKPGFICHQIRQEFVPVWSRCQTFLLTHQHSTGNRLSQLKGTYIQVRDLLDAMGPIARYHARSIRVCHIWRLHDGSYGSDYSNWFPHTRILQDETVNHLMSIVERLDDVHKDLEIQIELRCLGVWFKGYRAVRRVFTLRQRPYGRERSSDWSCFAGRFGAISIPFKNQNERCLLRSAPHSQQHRAEVWEVVNDWGR